MAYTLPAVQIQQEFAGPLTDELPDLNALIVGPEYEFLKYSDSDDRAKAFVGAYDNTQDVDYAYPELTPGAIVDLSSVQVIFDDLEAEYFSRLASAGAPHFKADPAELNVIGTTSYSAIIDTLDVGSVNALRVGGLYFGDLPNVSTEEYTVTVLDDAAGSGTFTLGTDPIRLSVTSDEGDDDFVVIDALNEYVKVGTRGVYLMLTGAGTVEAADEWTFTADAAARLSFKTCSNVNGDLFPRSSEFKSRDVRVGDVVELVGIAGSPADEVTFRSEVKAVIKENLSSVIEGAISEATNLEDQTATVLTPASIATPSASNAGDHTVQVVGELEADLPGGVLSDVYTISVIRGGTPGPSDPPVVRIVSASGTDDVSAVSISREYNTLLPYHNARGSFAVGDTVTGAVGSADVVAVLGNAILVDDPTGWVTGEQLSVGGDVIAELNGAARLSTTGPYPLGTKGLFFTIQDIIVSTEEDLVAGDFWVRSVNAAYSEVLAESNHTGAAGVVVSASVNPKFPNEEYRGALDTEYTVKVLRGGVFGVASALITSTGTDSSGPTPIPVPFTQPVAAAGNIGGQTGAASPRLSDVTTHPATDAYTAFTDIQSHYIGPPETYTVEVLVGGLLDAGTKPVLLITSASREDNGDPDGVELGPLTLATSTGGDLTGVINEIDGLHVIGLGTAFLSEVNIGDLFRIEADDGDGSTFMPVARIVDDEHLVLEAGSTLTAYDDNGTAVADDDDVEWQLLLPLPVRVGNYTVNDRGLRFTLPARLGDSTAISEGYDPTEFGAAGALVVGDKWTFKGQAVPVGTKGVYVTFQKNLQGGFVQDDKWTIGAESVKGGPATKLELKNNVPADFVSEQTNMDVRLLLTQQDVVITQFRVESPLELNYTTDSDSVTLTDGIMVTDPSWYDGGPGDETVINCGKLVPGTGLNPASLVNLPVDAASIYITYRALRTERSATVHEWSNLNDIEGQTGRIDVLNPISYAGYKALQNSQNRPIKYITLGSDNLQGYTEALEITKSFDNVYAFVPLSQDREVHQIFEQHVALMSTKVENRWRVALINGALVDKDELYVVNFCDTDSGQLVDDFVASVTADPVTGLFTLVEAFDTDFITKGVVAGDLFQTNFSTDLTGAVVWEEYEVASVVSQTVLKLKSGPTSAIATPSKFVLKRALSKSAQAQRLADIASSFAERRIFMVWPDTVGAEGAFVKGYYLCAAIAGQIAAFPPHQGFTNVQVVGFDDLSRSFEYFTKDHLNVMAGGGVYIVTQDVRGGVPYTRHQLSTDSASLITRELNITKNADSVSYFFRGLLEEIIGVYNVNAEAIDVVRSTFDGGIEQLKANRFPRIGTQIIDGEIVNIGQDEVFRDKIRVDLDIQFPPPLNNLDVSLVISV